MNIIRSSFLIPLLLTAPLAAQDDVSAPAPELARLEPLEGHWQGQGVAVMQPGAPSMNWTAKVQSRWVLGGHFLQTDSAIKFEGMGDMRIREYVGWDRENKHYVNLAVDNGGGGVLSRPHFIDDDTVVAIRSWVRDGNPQVERVVSKYGKDEWSFEITMLGQAGPANEVVTGNFERVDKVEPDAMDATASMMPAAMMPGHEHMARVARMVGEYVFTGAMVMAPGMPETKIRGRDRVRGLFGDSIVQVTTKGTAEGDSFAYEAHGFYAWDTTKECLQVLALNNMGEVGSYGVRFHGDDELISTHAGLRMGQPFVAQIVMHLDGQGRPSRVSSHSIQGDAEPIRDFHGSYVRVE